MKTINPELHTAVSATSIFALSDHNRLMPRIALAPEAGAGAGDSSVKGAFTPPPAGDPPADDGAGDKSAAGAGAGDDAGKGESKLSEQEAKLLKESMKRKEQIEKLETELKRFDGINPEEIKKLLDEKKSAEKAKKDAEKKAAEAAGDIERVKAMMAEEHKKELDTVASQLEEARKEMGRREAQINDLTIGQAFSNSNFVSDELVLTPSKTRAVYGAHFGYEDGKVVAYDKPAGSSERTKIVDARGEPLSFEAALRKLVEGDPDRDHILKSKLGAGAGAKPGSSKTKSSEETSELYGSARISAILSKGGMPKSKN